MRRILFIGLALFVLNSCSLNKSIHENTKVTKDLKIQNDSIISNIDRFNKDFINSEQTPAPLTPELLTIKKVDYTDFYFGDSLKESILDKEGDWIKIQLENKITSSSPALLIKKIGWYNVNTPNIIYLLSNKVYFSDLNPFFDNRIYKVPELSEIKQVNAFTTKPDLLDQKTLDILLAEKAMNFDGLKFDTKRFDFSNLAFGSYKGTVFSKCNLSNISAKREILGTNNDFTETLIENGTNKDMTFSFWKFKDATFFNSTIENTTFENCLFTTSSNVFIFNQVTLKNSSFVGTENVYFQAPQRKTNYEGCEFKDFNMYGTIGFEIQYSFCRFYDCEWQGVAFNNNLLPSKISGGYFSNLRIYGGNFSRMIIEAPGEFKPRFLATEIINANFSNSIINASFEEDCKIYGIGNADFSGINFTQSTFDDVTFGDQNQTTLFNLRNSNFTACSFSGNVIFIKCDLRGATFPTNSTNIQFVECLRE